jgi:acid phosphatase (class A)
VKRVAILSLCLAGAVVISATLLVRGTHLLAPNVTQDANWHTLLPPPPPAKSDADIADMAEIKRYQSQRNSPRWQQAKADISFDIFVAYHGVLGDDFTPSDQPKVAALMHYAQVQLSRASSASKAAFMRPRPYVTDPTLVLCSEDAPKNTSYPSGHAAWGWLSARIMADIYPAHRSSLMARGEDFGLSRVICGFHYPSDVVAGRDMGREVYDALQNDQTFQRLYAQASAQN